MSAEDAAASATTEAEKAAAAALAAANRASTTFWILTVVVILLIGAGVWAYQQYQKLEIVERKKITSVKKAKREAFKERQKQPRMIS